MSSYLDSVLGFFGKEAGMPEDAFSPEALQQKVNRGRIARQPIPALPAQVATPRQMIQDQSTPPPAPVTAYERPDEFTRGEDIIRLLAEAEERARLPKQEMQLQGTGDGKGGTLYFGGGLGDRALTEDEALEYIKQLDDYAKGEGFY